jgi:hypothetical protein
MLKQPCFLQYNEPAPHGVFQAGDLLDQLLNDRIIPFNGVLLSLGQTLRARFLLDELNGGLFGRHYWESARSVLATLTRDIGEKWC